MAKVGSAASHIHSRSVLSNLTVVGFAGDADCYDEGWGHFSMPSEGTST
ncbi:MAG: hypothetical protein H3Z50_02845 [archaeon]|nr:hypothetical protein [archaeon]MCP8306839.1 hypothetical protein [archaeon]